MSTDEETTLLSNVLIQNDDEHGLTKGNGEASLFSTIANLLNVTVGKKNKI